MDKKNKITLLYDMGLNIVGTILPIAVLQLVIYPLVARRAPDNYGLMLTAMSVVYLVGGTFGGTISTIRLLRQVDYAREKCVGDFNLINVGNIVACIVSSIIISEYYLNEYSLKKGMLLILLIITNYMENYLQIGFRLKMNYMGVVYSRILATVGQFLGFALFYISGDWEYIFIVSSAISMIYCEIKCHLLAEPFKKTSLMGESVTSFFSLGVANLLNRFLLYIDKLILYSLLGAGGVSVYYTATYIGKMIVMALEPINNVILTYTCKRKEISKHTWKAFMILGLASTILLYTICIITSGPIITYLFPQWADRATCLIPITTLSLAIFSFTNLLNTLVLKDCAVKMQILINGMSLVVYVVTAYVLYGLYGLTGFCLAVCFAYATKLTIIVTIFIRRMRVNEKQG